MSRTRLPALTPELQVSDLQDSLAFYQQVLGFNLLGDGLRDALDPR